MRIRARIAASAFQVLWRQFSLVQRFVLPFYLLATIEQQTPTARLKQNTVTISTPDERRQGRLEVATHLRRDLKRARQPTRTIQRGRAHGPPGRSRHEQQGEPQRRFFGSHSS